MRALLALAISAALVAAHAEASGGSAKKSEHGAKKSEHGAKPEHGKEGGDGKPKEGLFGSADNIVPLPVVIAPVVIRGKLDSHLYMFLAAETPSADDAKKLKEKLPYVLDDLILTVYGPAIDIAKPDAVPNYAALVDRIKSSINRVMGREIVTKIEVGKIDTAPY